ncbi:aminoacyl-tRNA hydrolase [Aerococcaceae bacterium WGS1372]
MKLVIGLGNPGNKYKGSRHNVGFEVIDELLRRHQLSMTDQKFRSDFTVWHRSGEKTLLMKPFTYMNLSGEALVPMMSYYGIDLDDVLVIHDDLDLDPGRIRLRAKGSSGGQNGVKSIIELLGTKEFKRIKVGIGRPQGGWKVVDHVLSPFTAEDRIATDEAVNRAVDAVEAWLDGETFANIMNEFN